MCQLGRKVDPHSQQHRGIAKAVGPEKHKPNPSIHSAFCCKMLCASVSYPTECMVDTQ